MQILGKVLDVGRGVGHKLPDRPASRLLLYPVTVVLNMRVGRIVGQVLMRLQLDDVHLVIALRLPSIEVCGSR